MKYVIKRISETLIFFIIAVGIAVIIMIGVSLIPNLFQHQCLEGAYIQTMKNCIASHDFNSSWCQARWLK